MAFSAKTDFVGIASVCTNLKLRSNGDNATNQVLQIPASDGSILGDEIFGHVKNPTCEYAVTACGALSDSDGGLVLGKAYSGASTSTPFALQHIHVTTGAGVEPVVTADAVQIEPSASQAFCTFEMDEVGVSPMRHALTFGAFSYTESTTCALQTADFDATITLDPTTINGNPVATDATAGIETVALTFWTDSDSTPPSITIDSNWHQTVDWTCTGPDSQLFQWTTTLTKYLEITAGTCSVAI